ncbi:MAG: GGDEF domain-containing protein [Burkholderiales bacterium]|nr:GGDEF domain-containing protein [Burkholderiales bacterium]
MSARPPVPAPVMEEIFKAINLGLIVVDAAQTVLLWNEWIEKHSRIPAAQALGKTICDTFEEAPSRAFLAALGNTLNYGLPVVLSNALHRSPLALYEKTEPAQENIRIHQSITLTPLGPLELTDGAGGERCCLIQISDSSTSIKREKILRTHSEILKREATTDGLTGIYNRRFFDEHYKMTLGQALRHQLPLSVFMVDIDFFKEYNDYYGHIAGDKALCQVASALKAQLLRASDVVARYGGEEFILMLPNMAPEAALQFAEKLRQAIWDLAIPHSKSGANQRLSVSIGCGNYDKASDAASHALLRCADAALYQAKKNGRNQIGYLPLQEFCLDPAAADELKIHSA